MSTRRQERVNSLLQHLLGEFLKREADFKGVVVAITHIDISQDLKFAKVFVSVFPESEEEGVLRKLAELRKEFMQYVGKHSKFKFLPSFEFIIDESEKKRAGVENLLKNI